MRQPVNPAHLDALITMINESAYFRCLGIVVTELRSGYARAELNIRPETHRNPFGSIHGGVCASLLDTALYWAAYCDQEEGVGFTSLDLSVTNLAMVQSGVLVAEAHAIKEGRSICLCDGIVTDEQNRKIAYGNSKLMIHAGRQSVKDAIAAMGYPALPPKFL